ncbi:hypothetical protein VC83_00433 [Pseudogymnoascus destructans]|uniref:Intradiol ring-cleavage dioxygenases domain-containing protein n=2 Tax=Pseudogymnoascus destructans TaxID=655981 RepID=L8G6Q1_PSED2|nr:uncharacterized protein VC83_00433 [Pseudogymnoascus destructans]ELR08524.1 hypothetical protein GMDG_03223 [Pseudogymnoascus destructans 20631-21]OAF63164.1 hypothetical protein VC83_00433 [Pseudogymnoascus destructans]
MRPDEVNPSGEIFAATHLIHHVYSSTRSNDRRVAVPKFTQHVVDTIGPATDDPATDDRTRAMIGVRFMNSIGQASTPITNEGLRICDVLGLESLVDEIAHRHASESGSPTSSSILVPFWSLNAPFREWGSKPVANAVFDFWQASSNGKYDFQDADNQTDNNLRGKFRTNEKGKYWFYYLKPTAYSLPTDGPAGVLLKLLDRHPFRPAHFHLMISHDSYIPVTTQIFPSDDQYLTTDTVFAVKDDLVVDFLPFEGERRRR